MGNTDPGLGAMTALPPSPTAPAGPAVQTVPCATCGKAVDPLRADRVSIVRGRFRYFCTGDCHAHFDPNAGAQRLPQPRRRSPRPLEPSPPSGDVEAAGARHEAAVALESVDAEWIEEAGASRTGRSSAPAPAVEAEPPRGDVVPTTDVSTLLLGLAVVGSLLAVGLALAGSSSVALSARVLLAFVGCGAFIAQAAMGQRDATEPHPLAILAAPIVAVCIAAAARLSGDPRTDTAATLAGLVTASVAGTVWLMQQARRPVDNQRTQIRDALSHVARRVVGDEAANAAATDLRPGEEILVEAGDLVPVDATITAGVATVQPWLGAKHTEERSEGDTLVAGARLIEGRLRAITGWAGNDRAWMRLTHDARRRADVHAPLARLGRIIAERGAVLASGVAALTAYASGQDTLGILMFAVAAHATIANAGVARIGGLQVARGIVASLQRGIAYRTADSFDRAGKVSTAAFCARGTVLVGEPEVANVEPFGDHEPERVLALVAGAESGETHPAARAILRAARERGVRPDGVRSPNVQPGLGVTAFVSTGEPLVVGSRALMLRERISIAAAEARITDLEAMGRTAVLVALGGRLIGIIGLQDGLRPGARAAVQHLLDVGVEPVLLSGDARETCEALGRALDIEHVRPEVLPTDRGEEVQRLADGGATVAVLGRSPADDAALGAADVSVALDVAGSSSAEWSVQLASENVRDAAFAIKLAHRCRSEARIGLTLALAPGIGGAIAVAFGLLPPAVAPIAAVAGAFVSLIRYRSQD